MPNTFSTKSEPFKRDYQDNAHMQKGFNRHIVDGLVNYILRVLPETDRQPLKICDLCCGDGGVTAAVLAQLEAAGISVEKIVGYDISEQQIAVANEQYSSDPKLQFTSRDVLAIDEQAEYDVVISLFGLHWIDTIQQAAKVIQRMLKPSGKLMFFVPLEKSKLFTARSQLTQSDKWARFFQEYELKPFRAKPADYLEAFTTSFTPEDPEGFSGMQYLEYTREELARFLSSWMPELRHLPVEQQQIFLDELLDQVPQQDGQCQDVAISDSGGYAFNERFFWYFAGRKDNTAPSTAALQEATPHDFSF